MVEVFKTNISDKRKAHIVLSELYARFPNAKINFDLDDCDRILRLEGLNLCIESVIEVVNRMGFDCEILD